MFSLIKRAQGKKWKNWAETHEGQPESTFYPSSVDEVVTIVKEAANQGKKIRVIGAGHHLRTWSEQSNGSCRSIN